MVTVAYDTGKISTHALTEGDPEQARVLRPLDISTHALTEGDQWTTYRKVHREISTHALTEGDRTAESISRSRSFQLTPSRRATHLCSLVRVFFHISTHALTEGDSGKKAQSRH